MTRRFGKSAGHAPCASEILDTDKRRRTFRQNLRTFNCLLGDTIRRPQWVETVGRHRAGDRVRRPTTRRSDTGEGAPPQRPPSQTRFYNPEPILSRSLDPIGASRRLPLILAYTRGWSREETASESTWRWTHQTATLSFLNPQAEAILQLECHYGLAPWREARISFAASRAPGSSKWRDA